jgi:RNA polymerase sigma-70 factor (ECF subfamily)
MTDAELVARAIAGDTEAFAELVTRHHAACLRYAAHSLGDRAEAEDIVQETLIRAHRSLGRYEERQQFRAWLFRILINRCRTAASLRLARQRRHHDAYDGNRTTADTADSVDLHSRLTRALAGLDVAHREAFLLKLGEGLEYNEIARMTGVSVPALKMRVKRARDHVRAQWEGDG